jgi:hypothetical protein
MQGGTLRLEPRPTLARHHPMLLLLLLLSTFLTGTTHGIDGRSGQRYPRM